MPTCGRDIFDNLGACDFTSDFTSAQSVRLPPRLQRCPTAHQHMAPHHMPHLLAPTAQELACAGPLLTHRYPST